MAKPKYATAPAASSGMPPGIPYIVGNEAAERFSFYGMKAILVVFMTQHLLNSAGNPAPMSEVEAKESFHWFVSAAYFFPILGALLADAFLGKYRTIMLLSVVYCLGHLALALDETRLGLFTGLVLVAIGSGGIKPCVSAHVGDQFGAQNQHLLEKVFSWFYFAINFGAFFSTLLTPWLLKLDGYGPRWAFGVPGVLMLLATIVFWMGRNKFVHVPPGGMKFVRELFSREGLSVVLNLTQIFVFVAVFWCLYDQSGSAWVLQAQKMDRTLFPASWFSSWQGTQYEFLVNWLYQEWDAAQVGAINPILILIYIPLFAYVIFPLIDLVFPLTPLRKMSMGLFLTAASFVICAWVEILITRGETPYIGWQILAYMVLTAAEVMVSITCLEFSYTQAAPRMKSFVMALYLLSISAGNLLAAVVNKLISENESVEKSLQGANYYWFFAALMFVAACLFVVTSQFYRGRTYLQDTAAAE